jgi:hypothetical protein
VLPQIVLFLLSMLLARSAFPDICPGFTFIHLWKELIAVGGFGVKLHPTVLHPGHVGGAQTFSVKATALPCPFTCKLAEAEASVGQAGRARVLVPLLPRGGSVWRPPQPDRQGGQAYSQGASPTPGQMLPDTPTSLWALT